MGGATLGVIAWADDHYDSSAVARTMGLTTFAISNVLFSLTTRDEQRSIFSLDVLEDRMFLLLHRRLARSRSCFGTELGIFHRILGTVHLDLHQWLDLHRRRARDRAGVRGPADPAEAPRTGRRPAEPGHRDGSRPSDDDGGNAAGRRERRPCSTRCCPSSC